jgi:hypothetical protein
MNIMRTCSISNNFFMLGKAIWSYKFTQCSPKVSPSGIIFFSILAMNREHSNSSPKTLNLTPPELMRNRAKRLLNTVCGSETESFR